MSARTTITSAALDRLNSRISDLEHQIAVADAAVIDARGAGDIAENPDFQIALTERTRLEDQLLTLTRSRDTAVVDDDTVYDHVSDGCLVTIQFADDPEPVTYRLGALHSHDGIHETLTPTSPLGAALLGTTTGTTVNYASPAGPLAVTVTHIA